MVLQKSFLQQLQQKAGTIASLRDCKAIRGTLSKMTTAIVGLDDGVAIIIFAIAIAILKVSLGEESLSVSSALVKPLIEILGAIALGIVIGAILAYSAKKSSGRESILIISLAGILTCIGLAEIFHLSSILACMFLGARNNLYNMQDGRKDERRIYRR